MMAIIDNAKSIYHTNIIGIPFYYNNNTNILYRNETSIIHRS